MKPFDLEAAKRGEPIQVLYDNIWTNTHFVGTSKPGLVVAQGYFQSGEFSAWTTDHVRMVLETHCVLERLRASPELPAR